MVDRHLRRGARACELRKQFNRVYGLPAKTVRNLVPATRSRRDENVRFARSHVAKERILGNAHRKVISMCGIPE